MQRRSIEFRFSVGSTYTYPSVMRVDGAAAKAGLSVEWRPFNVRHTLRKMGGYRPFADKPMKLAYMWRDIERRCQLYGLKARLPVPYSLEDIELPNRVALIGMREGGGVDYVKEAYRRWFRQGEPADKEANLSASLEVAGPSPRDVLSRAAQKEAHDALLAASEKANTRGVFGAPSFAVGDEIFWEDDRLEDALAWAQNGMLKRL